MAELNSLTKPIISKDQVEKFLQTNYGLQTTSITQLNGYDDKNFLVLTKQSSSNPFITQISPSGYVFKVINLLDSQRDRFFEAQTEILLHLKRKGINCSKPIRTKKGEYYTTVTLESGQHIIRLLEYIEGEILFKIKCTPEIFYSVGRYIGNLDNFLEDFYHDFYSNHTHPWTLECLPKLKNNCDVVQDPKRKKIVENILGKFQSRVLDKIESFERGIIHNDFNEQNIIVNKVGDEWNVDGIIDFGDVTFSCYLFELAITMAYMIMQGNNIDVAGYVLAGYMSARTVAETELKELALCVSARIVQSLVMGLQASRNDPGNDYILVTQKSGWTLLEQLVEIPENVLLHKWQTIAKNYKKEMQ